MPPSTLSVRAAELLAIRQRLAWATLALAAVVALTLLGDPVARLHPVMVAGNGCLLGAAVLAALGARRGWWTAATMHAVGAGLALALTAITLGGYALRPDLRFVAMLIVQLLGASLLFFSIGWLIAYLATAVVASTWVALALDRGDEATLIATCAILAMTIHLALRQRLRGDARAHAVELADALALAHRQLEDKERAERERAQAQRDSESYQAQLLQAQKMEAIGTLAGGVAHDMNNALAAIIGFAECIRLDATDSQSQDDAEQILLAARQAADLTRNLLGFGRRGQFRRERSRPESVITSLATLLARTLPKGIKVETRFADQLAPFEVDASALSQALVNLCLNASDAMNGEGVLSLGARLEHVKADAGRAMDVAPGRYVVLTVKDTGHGMSAAVQARIFEPFFTTKAQGHGTGLGLAMVYGTVKRHEGAITVDSAPGQGTTFALYLPAAAAPATSPDLPAVTAALPTISAPALPSGHGSRILIIDDEEMVRTVMVRALERAGYAVQVAANGRLGLDVLARDEAGFELVILDMAMPVMAGPEAFRRARSRHPALKVLLASGFTSSDDARALLAEGALGLLEKPFTPASLLTAVGQAIHGSSLGAVGSA